MAKKSNGNGGGNALTVIEPANYPALDPNSDVREAMLANMQGAQMSESDLVRVPTPAGGGTKWVVPGLQGEEILAELTGILVYYGPRGVLWPTEEPNESMPLLLSHDLITAVRVGDDYGDIDPDELEKYRLGDLQKGQIGEREFRTHVYDWLGLPWNQWGSGKNGIGKRCKESRLLFLLREAEVFPLLVRAQTGSLETVRPFVMRLSNVGVPYWRAVVSLGLQAVTSHGGQKYAQIVPTLVGTLDKETGEQVRKLYTEPLRAMASGALASGREGTGE